MVEECVAWIGGRRGAAARELGDDVGGGAGPGAGAVARGERAGLGLAIAEHDDERHAVVVRAEHAAGQGGGVGVEPGAQAGGVERAVAGNGSSWALYLLGILHLRDTGPSGTTAGIKRLREAIALDPDLGQAWRALARALEQRAKDPAALDQLRRDYQARFGEPLR
jgi:hypothetical protein